MENTVPKLRCRGLQNTTFTNELGQDTSMKKLNGIFQAKRNVKVLVEGSLHYFLPHFAGKFMPPFT